jgi:hypothetical protein
MVRAGAWCPAGPLLSLWVGLTAVLRRCGSPILAMCTKLLNVVLGAPALPARPMLVEEAATSVSSGATLIDFLRELVLPAVYVVHVW